MRKTLSLAVVLLTGSIAHAQDFPTSALTAYSDFRKALLKYGWMPDNSYGDKMYGFPEVICGNSMCTARWKAKNEKGLLITLWKDGADELRVAPQSDQD